MFIQPRRIVSLRLEPLEPRRLCAAAQIVGVQAAALDQPRINAYVSRTPSGDPLTADFFGFETFNIDAFFDTGASGILLSNDTADALGVNRAPGVTFTDVGVGGSDDFGVSEPLYVHLAGYTPDSDIDNLNTFNSVYTQQAGPVRAQVGPLDSEPDPFLGGLDVIGMPAMAGKVVVIDPSPVDSFADTMRTYVYNPGTPFNPGSASDDPGIPSVNTRIPLSYVSFDQFTQTTPAGSTGPTLRNNPFIGRNPFVAGDTHTRPLAAYNGHSSSGNWLLDTGAAASILSRARAGELGVSYVGGTYGTQNPKLQGLAPGTKTFSLTIGGIGGTVKLMGFFMDSLTLPTADSQGLQYVGAPVLIGDIGVVNPTNGFSYTLDGIFGMNYLAASANIVESTPFPDFSDLTPGAFDWITFDEPAGVLGLQLRDEIPRPSVTATQFDYDVAPNAFYIEFNRDVGASLSIADLVVRNTTTGETIPSSGLALAFDQTLNTATLTFPGFQTANGTLRDGNYHVTVLAGGVQDQFGAAMAADFSTDFYFLGGDANRDRTVSLTDFARLASNFNKTDRVWADGDFNLDGDVTIVDFGIMASRWKKTIPAPANRPLSNTLLANRTSDVAPAFSARPLIALLQDRVDMLPSEST